jgi:hypothetical protein
MRWLLPSFLGLMIAAQGSAQSFRLMRYDENYEVLRDSARNFWPKLKYIPLDRRATVYLSFGGEIRQEFDAFDNEDWGKVHLGQDNFYLQRYDLHIDFHAGDRLRVFAQWRSAIENGRPTGPRPIDEDKGNVQNLFVDLKILRWTSDSLILRGGRQELNYGAGRLISVREGPNVRLTFTGAKFIYAARNISIDAFAMENVQLTPGFFDDRNSKQLNFWGTYSTLKLGPASLDLYYLGNKADTVVYDAGAGKEVRHTFGGRLWKNTGALTYDLEGAYQTGAFDHGSIRAWTASADIGYHFLTLPLKPSVGIRNDYISGDARKGDHRLQTFNPLYPKGGYFGFDPQVGPVNLIDIHPYGTLTPGSKFLVTWDVVFNWRSSLNDGVYRPSGAFNLSGQGSTKRYIGTDYLGKIIYTFNSFFSVDFGIQYFRTGTFIKSEIPQPKNAFLTNTRISFKF